MAKSNLYVKISELKSIFQFFHNVYNFVQARIQNLFSILTLISLTQCKKDAKNIISMYGYAFHKNEYLCYLCFIVITK